MIAGTLNQYIGNCAEKKRGLFKSRDGQHFPKAYLKDDQRRSGKFALFVNDISRQFSRVPCSLGLLRVSEVFTIFDVTCRESKVRKSLLM